MKKQIKKLTSIMFAISLILCIIGCKKEPEFNILDYVYTVSFESNGGTEIDSQTVVIGETVEKPVDPVHTEKPETEKFAGWYTDKELTKEYDFLAKVENSFTLYAKWRHEHKGVGEWQNYDDGHFKFCDCGTVQNREKCNYEDKEIIEKATCTQEGKKMVRCTVCLDEKEETIPKIEHSGIWETTEDPTETESGKMQIVCEVCGETVTKELQPVPEGFVLVKAGTFQMGSKEGYDNNKPVHEVTITKPFYMGKCEVTQAEYEKYCSYGSDSPSSSYGDGDDYPAYNVSWYNAIVYCNKRSIAEGLTPCYSINDSKDPEDWGKIPTEYGDPLCDTWNAVECNWNANGYRLPTEAEWEHAARAGDNTVDSLTYSGTSDVNELKKYAWCQLNAKFTTHEVGRMLPNAYGLYDMSGNVWEWCWNWSTNSYDTEAEGGSDPTGISAGSERVHRGGAGWGCNEESCCAVSYRADYPPRIYDNNIGFRVVRQAN